MGLVSVNIDNFENEVLQSDKMVLIDFWAAWCGPCQMLSPIVDKFAEENSQYKVVKINVDEEKELAIKYDIMSIPTLVVINNGKEVNRSTGVIPMEMISGLMQTK